MNLRENYLYIGMDLHKDTHTAVLVNCWNEKLETIVIENKPSDFIILAKKVNKKAMALNLSPIYGLENAYGYGRSLTVWLIENGYSVKDVNPALAYDQRKSFPTYFGSRGTVPRWPDFLYSIPRLQYLHIRPAHPPPNRQDLRMILPHTY